MLLNLLFAPTLWISEQGKDTNPGTARAPIATLARAKALLQPGMTVQIRGRIEVISPITFGQEANGVTFRGPGVISGGIELRQWKLSQMNGHPAWESSVPTDLRFQELWVGREERRVMRPRFPKVGFHGFTGWAEPADVKGDFMQGQSAIRLAPGDLDKPRRNLTDIDVFVHQLWTTSRLPVASYDRSTGVARFTKKSVFHLSANPKDELSQYYLDNVAESFDSPGEWYLDRTMGKVFYIPKQSEDISKFVAYAPMTPTVIRFSGCKDVVIRDLRISHCEYRLPADAAGDVQAAFTVPGALQILDSERVKIDHCQIAHVGGYGVEINGQSKACSITNSKLSDLGAGGVTIGNGPDGCIVADNEIVSGGRLFPAGIGILGRLSGNNQIVHNRIRDFFYTGISVGWDWGFADTAAKNNLIAFNDISDIGQDLLSDMGGIYVLGKQPNSRISNNRVRNISAIGYGGWGIYLDEGSTGWTVENNVVTDTKTGGFHIHYGGNNVIQNNIFAFARHEGQLIRSRDDKQGPIQFAHNLVVARPGEAPMVIPSWLHRAVTMTGMLYATPEAPLPFGDDGTGKFVRVELDRNGLPPLNSEIFRMGFKPIDMSTVGPRRSR